MGIAEEVRRIVGIMGIKKMEDAQNARIRALLVLICQESTQFNQLTTTIGGRLWMYVSLFFSLIYVELFVCLNIFLFFSYFFTFILEHYLCVCVRFFLIYFIF